MRSVPFFPDLPLPYFTHTSLFTRTVLYSVSQGRTSRKVTCAVLSDSVVAIFLGQNDGETVTEDAPAIDNWEEVTPDPAISYEEFISMNEDVAVCDEAEDGESGDEADNS
ncbi:unnamed protein product [Timema podura]|uniref:Uncharacterized protein n=1 Tax=Timema podura TaxID=61482 RepID=A0ABN7NXL2_TIMPD|nr:unnamed protein product [Timema podura]